MRSNAREVDALLSGRLLCDLKGLTLPIHVMVDEHTTRKNTNFVIMHQLPHAYPLERIVPIGNGLGVEDPAMSLCRSCSKRAITHIACAMFEACGTYALCPDTSQIKRALELLLGNRETADALKQTESPLREFYDAAGRHVTHDKEAPWQLAFDRADSPTRLWKRPPLSSTQELKTLCDALKGMRGTKDAGLAIRLVDNGSASPLESKAHLLLFSGRRNGGEWLAHPWLNRRIDFSDSARALAGNRYCIGDMVFPLAKAVIEVNGFAFHADRQGFSIQSGRTAALKSMGYRVIDLNYQQLSNLEQLDSLLPAIAHDLGLPLRPKTTTFLKRREILHTNLFDTNPYEV